MHGEVGEEGSRGRRRERWREGGRNVIRERGRRGRRKG